MATGIEEEETWYSFTYTHVCTHAAVVPSIPYVQLCVCTSIGTAVPVPLSERYGRT